MVFVRVSTARRTGIREPSPSRVTVCRPVAPAPPTPPNPPNPPAPVAPAWRAAPKRFRSRVMRLEASPLVMVKTLISASARGNWSSSCIKASMRSMLSAGAETISALAPTSAETLMSLNTPDSQEPVALGVDGEEAEHGGALRGGARTGCRGRRRHAGIPPVGARAPVR